jgi:hypothetical protein
MPGIGLSAADSSTKTQTSAAGDILGSSFEFGGTGNVISNKSGILIAILLVAGIVGATLIFKKRGK